MGTRVVVDQWLQDIKDTKQLTVFPTPRLVRSRWGPIFDRALDKFNELSTTHKLVVKLTRADGPPDSEKGQEGGANVQFDYSGSVPRYRFNGEEHTPDEPFSATEIHGLTETFTRGGRSVKAFIFVPMYPLANFEREVGDEVKLFIAVHELVHAAGCLSNDDHSPENNPDVFCGPPVSTPQFIQGQTAAEDKVGLKSGQLTPTFFIPPVHAPPIKLSARTAGLIRNRWS